MNEIEPPGVRTSNPPRIGYVQRTPAESTARTWNSWVAGFRPVYCAGDLHAVNPVVSSAHWNVAVG